MIIQAFFAVVFCAMAIALTHLAIRNRQTINKALNKRWTPRGLRDWEE